MHERIATRVWALESALQGGRALFVASQEVTPDEWRAYVAALGLDRGFTSERVAMGYAPWRQGSARILHLAPLDDSNRSVTDYDLWSEPGLRAALERARDTGRAAITGRLSLRADAARAPPVFWLVTAVYGTGRPTATTDERRRSLEGFVLLRAGIGDVLLGAADPPDLHVELVDGAGPGAPAIDPAGHTPRFVTTSTLAAGDRFWTLRFASAPRFEMALGQRRSPYVLVVGTLLTLLLASLVAYEGRGRERTERLVAERTADLRREVGDRQRAQEAAQEAEARLRALLQAGPDAIIAADSAGRIMAWNQGAEKMFGWSEPEIHGQPLTVVMPERYREAHSRGLGRLAETGESRVLGQILQLHGLRRSGEEFPVEVSLAAYSTHEGQFFSGVLRDTSERHRILEMFRTAVETAPDGVLVVNGEGTIVLVNAHALRIFGWSRDELVGQPLEVLVPQRFRRAHLGFRTEFFRDPHVRPMGVGRDLYGLRRDGTEFPVEISLGPIQTPTGLLVRGTVVDITERKRAEEELRRLNAELRERTQELQRKNEEVESFVYVVSHDLRAPLVNLQGFSRELELSGAELQRELAKEPLPVAQAAALQRIVREDIPTALRYITASTAKSERLLDALLRLSRSGRQEYRFERVDMAELVRQNLDSLRALVQAAGAEVAVGDLPPAQGDRTALGQVFANLMVNAVHYLDPARPGRIEVGGERRDSHHHYWVRDNGVGIAASARSRVFQVFQRFRPEMAPGEGIGLSIVKRIIERHGGEISVDSVEGAGTTVHVKLPAVKEGGDR